MTHRKLTAAILVGSSILALSACSGNGVQLPSIPSLTVPSGIPTNVGDGLGMQLQAQGFSPNADKTEYTKKGANGSGDVTIVMGSNGPTNIKHNNALLACTPTPQSVINGAAASALGNTSEEVAKQFCGV